MTSPQELVNSYLQWLKQNISVREADGWMELSTPFLDRHNDHLQVYVRADADGSVLTDDGYVLRDLELSGCDVSTAKRQELLRSMVAGFGVQVKDGSLQARATKTTFPQKKHALLQAMLAVGDLFMTSRSLARSLFQEEVEQFLVEHQIRCVPSVQMTGRSGLAHRFDYVVAGWGTVPERIIEVVNEPTRDKVTSVLFAWNDIRELRGRPVTMYTVMNDQEKPIPKALTAACANYGVSVVPWSERREFVGALIA